MIRSGTNGPMRLPNWWASIPPIATTRRVRQSSSQARMLRSGGPSSARPGAIRKRSICGTLATDSPVSVTKLHSSMPSSASQSSASNGIPGPARLKRFEPSENGWAAKPKPPAARTARQMPAASSPEWSISSSMPKAR